MDVATFYYLGLSEAELLQIKSNVTNSGSFADLSTGLQLSSTSYPGISLSYIQNSSTIEILMACQYALNQINPTAYPFRGDTYQIVT